MPRSLVWATSIDVLPPDRVVERRDGYLVVRSPANPAHYWGNLLLFDDAPAAGDGSGGRGCSRPSSPASRASGITPSRGTRPVTSAAPSRRSSPPAATTWISASA